MHVLLWLLACHDPAPVAAAGQPDPVPAPPAAPAAAPTPSAATAPSTVGGAFPPPDGFARVPGDDFGRWLEDRGVKPADVPVRTYDGRETGHHGRVVDLPLVKGDLQQCADSAIRLRAEWLKEQGKPVSFHATSGDPIPWDRYAGGERPYADGNHLLWKKGGDRSWDGYLSSVFMWAGTLSLSYDTVPDDVPRPGDVVVHGGSPGHAVVLMDVAKRGDETVVLVGEGFMPAMDFHVEEGPEDGWLPWDGGVDVPSWGFLSSDGLRRWK